MHHYPRAPQHGPAFREWHAQLSMPYGRDSQGRFKRSRRIE